MLVEAEGAGHRVQQLGGGAAFAALFQPGVVVGAHARQHGDLLAAQSGYPPVADPGDAHQVRGEVFPAGPQVFAEEVVVPPGPPGLPGPS